MESFATSTILVYAVALFLIHLSVGYGVYHFIWKKRKHRSENEGAVGMMLGFFAGTWILLYFLGVAALILAGSFKSQSSTSLTNDCREQIVQLEQEQKLALEAYRNFKDKTSVEAKDASEKYLSLSLSFLELVESPDCAEQ